MSSGYAGLGVKFALRRRRVALLTVLSIAISVSLLYSSLSVGVSLRANAAQFIQQTSSPIDITVSSTKWASPITSELMTAISQDPSVVNVTPRIEEFTQVYNGSEWIHLLLIGLNPIKESHIGNFTITDGSADINSSYCFMSDTAMTLLNLSTGQQVELYTSAGIHFFEIIGHGNALDKGVVGPAVFVHIESAWDIYGIRYADNASNHLLLEVDGIYEIQAVTDRISLLCGEDFVVSNQKAHNLWIASVFLTQTESVLVSLVIAAFFVASLRVFSSFSLAFSERRYETGLQLAYGATRSQVFSVLLTEISIVGIAGSILGLVVGLATGFVTTYLITLVIAIQSPANVASLIQPVFVVDPLILLISSIAGLSLTLVVGFIPAIIASRQPVIDSLRHVQFGISSPFSIPDNLRRRTWNAMVVIGSSLSIMVAIQILSDVLSLGLIRSDMIRILSIPSFIIFVGSWSKYLAQPKQLVNAISTRSKQTVRRLFSANLRRRSMGAFLVFNLFVSVSILFFVSSNVGYTITTSWENTLGWQSSTANVVAYVDETARTGTYEHVKNFENLTNIAALSTTTEFMMHGNVIEPGLIFGIEPAPFQNLASIGIIDSVDLASGLSVIESTNSCIISEHTSQILNVRIGDTFEVADRVNLTVFGVCESSAPIFLFTFASPMFIFVDTQTWRFAAGEPFEADGILLDSSAPEDAVSALSELPGVYPVLVSIIVHDYSAALQSLRFTIDIGLGFLMAAAVASAVLGGWSAASSRRRELGIIRALGMEQEDTARALSLESAIPMLSGVFVGSVLGLFANLALADIIARFTGHFFLLADYRPILLIGISLVLSLLASYYAILRATRVSVIDLLTNR